MSADPELNWTVRPARADDAGALALVAGASLLETFHGLIPAADLVAHATGKSSPEAFRAFVASETARWGAVARQANIRLD